MRAILAWGLALAVLVLGAAYGVPRLADPEPHAARVAAEVERLTGRRMVVGVAELRMWPAPVLRLHRVALANRPEARSRPFEAAMVELELGWGLLWGSPELQRIRAVEPVLRLERRPDGGFDWPGFGPAQVGGALPELAVARGRIEWNDRDRRTHLEIGGIDATLRGTSAGVRAVGRGMVAGAPIAFDASATQAPGERASSISAVATVQPGAARLSFRGLASAGKLRGQLQIDADSAVGFARALGLDLPPPAAIAGAFAGGLLASAEISATLDALSFDNLALRSGEIGLTGAGSVAFGARPVVELTVAVPWLDIDQLAALPSTPAGPAVRPPQGRDTARLPAPAHGPVDWPALADVSLDLTADTIGFRGGIIRDVRLSGVASRGDLVISHASAALPGGTRIAAIGQLTSEASGRRAEATVDLRADNMRDLLSWLGLPVARVPAGRLLRLDAKARIDADSGGVALHDIDARFDGTRVGGQASLDLRARPKLGADLVIDRINLDGYAAMLEPLLAAVSGAPGAERVADLEAAVRLQAAEVVVGGTPLRGVEASAAWRDRVLQVERLGIADAIGSRLDATVRLALAGAAPAFSLQADAADAAGLLRRVGLSLSAALPVSVAATGRIDGSDGVELREVRIAAGRARIAAAGALRFGTGALSAALQGEISGARADLAARFGADGATGRLAIPRVRLDDLAAMIAAPAVLGGHGAVAVDFMALGPEPGAGGLSGSARIRIAEGQLLGFDLERLRDVLRADPPPDDAADLLNAAAGGATAFSSLDASLQLRHGVATVARAEIRGEGSEIVAWGAIDLARRTVDLKSTVTLRDAADFPMLSIDVAGPFDAPKIGIDGSTVLKYLARRRSQAQGGTFGTAP